jgi:protein-tyrosine phosphatase
MLPGVDDGAPDMAGALAMARVAVASGTTAMALTPHIDERWSVKPSEVGTRAGALVQALHEADIPLEVLTGGEVALSRLIDLSEQELDEVRLGEGPYLLLEAPLSPSAGDFDMILLRLRERGEQILLAHPERSPLFQRDPERLVRLVGAGVLCSITAGSIWGQFGKRARRFTLDILREGLVHDVASDAHDHQRRPPGLGEALDSAAAEIPGISSQVDWLTRLAPAAILAGEPLPPKPPLR